jgi:hypothetical protein
MRIVGKILRATSLAALVTTLGACATSFTGSPHVENGRQGCEAKCRGQGMELAGMVYMGEYSDACVCALPGKSASLDADLLAVAPAVAGGSAGVVMQMQRQQEQQQQQNY